jgi:hypothetical protein
MTLFKRSCKLKTAGNCTYDYRPGAAGWPAGGSERVVWGARASAGGVRSQSQNHLNGAPMMVYRGTART